MGVAEILITRVLRKDEVGYCLCVSWPLSIATLLSAVHDLIRIRRDGDTCKRPIAHVFGHFTSFSFKRKW